MTSTDVVPQKRPYYGGGRTPGQQNPDTRKRIRDAIRGGVTPMTVMIRNMRHFFNLAEKLEETRVEDIEKWLTTHNEASTADKVKFILDQVSKTVDLRDRAQKCAAQLAPYIHPALAAIQHSGELGVSNIVRVPEVAESTEQWLETVSANKTLPETNKT